MSLSNGSLISGRLDKLPTRTIQSSYFLDICETGLKANLTLFKYLSLQYKKVGG